MKRRSTTIRFPVLVVRVQSGETQSGSMVGRLTFTISPSLSRYLPPPSCLFPSRFTRHSQRSRCAPSLPLLTPLLVLSILRARASAFTLRVHLLPRGTSFNQNDASHMREARTHARTSLPLPCDVAPAMTVLLLEKFASFSFTCGRRRVKNPSLFIDEKSQS